MKFFRRLFKPRRRHHALKDPRREAYLVRNRAIVAGIFSVTLILILTGRLLYLQVLHHEHFTTLSEENRVTTQAIAPTRGLIYDRKGRRLADNVPRFSLELVPERVEDIDATLKAIQRLIRVTSYDLYRFNVELKRSRRFKPIPLRFRLTDEEVAAIAVNRHRLPGVEITSRLTRQYPYGKLTAHSVGYVGRINEKELKQLDPTNYSATNIIGKIGVEKSHEAILHGVVGYQEVETNVRGRILRVLERDLPVPGEDLQLTIDLDLQRVASEALGEERGAVVAIEPATGAVLAMVSTPSFDSNLFVDGIDPKNFNRLNFSNDRPLFNRALRGQYPPGSTTKPFMGLAGLENRVISGATDIMCIGYYTLPGEEHRYRDWKKYGHGHVNLKTAISQSCDVYFYDLARKLGIDRISAFLGQFGFGRRTGVDIGGEKAGLNPTREWKRRARNLPWFPGETLITGIGQGFMMATPIQLASATAALANHGQRMRPYLVQATGNMVNGELKPLPPLKQEKITLREDNHRAVVLAMQEVVHGARGTARRISRGIQYKLAGKTGTAQVFGVKQDAEYKAEELEKRLHDHALFISFAPVEDPKIAVAVIVENGGSGSGVAAPIARKVSDAYLLPLLKLEEKVQP